MSRLLHDTVRAMLNVRPTRCRPTRAWEAGIRRPTPWESFDRNHPRGGRSGTERTCWQWDASEKNWGLGYLNFQPRPPMTESSSNYNVGMSYTPDQRQRLGRRVADRGVLGTAGHLKTDFYTSAGALPDLLRRDTSLAYDKTQRRVFFPEESRSSSGVSYLDPVQLHQRGSRCRLGIASPGAASPWAGGQDRQRGDPEPSPTRMPMPPPGDPKHPLRARHPSTAATSPYQGVYWDIKGATPTSISTPRTALRSRPRGELPAGDDRPGPGTGTAST